MARPHAADHAHCFLFDYHYLVNCLLTYLALLWIGADMAVTGCVSS